MYFRRRRQYTFTRDAILFSGASRWCAYALFPVAPPRLLPETGIIDTLQAFNNLSYQAQSTSFFVNPYAAMPSLHVGWAVLVAIGVVLAYPGNRLVLAAGDAASAGAVGLDRLHGQPLLPRWRRRARRGSRGLAFAIAMQRWGYACD